MDVTVPGNGNPAIPLADQLGQPIVTARQLGIPVDGQTDSSPRLAAVCAALAGTGTLIRIRAGDRVLMAGGAQVLLNGVGLVGDGIRDRAYPYGTVGSQIWITDTARSPFLAQSGWSLSGLNFFWPGQTEAAYAANGNAPIAYPALLAAKAGSGVTHFDFTNNTVLNAFDFIDTGGETFGAGTFFKNNIYAVRRIFTVRKMPEVVFIDQNLLTPGAYENEVLGRATRRLINWTASNGTFLLVPGDGTPTSFTKQGGAEAFRCGRNYLFAYNKGVHVNGGSLGLCNFGDLSMDQVAFPILVEHGYLNADFPGGTWIARQYGEPYVDVPCTVFSVADPSPDQAGGRSTRISCGATITATGPLAALSGSNMASFDFHGDASALNNTMVANSYDGVTVDCPNIDLVISGRMASVHHGGIGVRNRAARSVRLASAYLSGWKSPIANESMTTLFTTVGVVTAATTGPYSIVGPGRANIKGAATCSLDKPIQP